MDLELVLKSLSERRRPSVPSLESVLLGFGTTERFPKRTRPLFDDLGWLVCLIGVSGGDTPNDCFRSIGVEQPDGGMKYPLRGVLVVINEPVSVGDDNNGFSICGPNLLIGSVARIGPLTLPDLGFS